MGNDTTEAIKNRGCTRFLIDAIVPLPLRRPAQHLTLRMQAVAGKRGVAARRFGADIGAARYKEFTPKKARELNDAIDAERNDTASVLGLMSVCSASSQK